MMRRCLARSATRLAVSRLSTAPLTNGSAAVEAQVALPPVTTLSEEEAMLRSAAARFSADEVLPRSAAMDAASLMDPDLIRALFDAGFMGVEIPEEYGGAGSSFTAACLVIEELAKVDCLPPHPTAPAGDPLLTSQPPPRHRPPHSPSPHHPHQADPAVSVMVDIHNTIVNNTFSLWASEEHKRTWLPQLATEKLGAFALSEVGSGSDAFALRTSAVQEGGEGGDYVLNGEKMWISNSEQAGVFLVMANAAPERGYKGITCFVVPADSPGLSLGPAEDKLGIRASSTCPLRLDGVRVPASAVLGEFGKGYKYAIEILNEGRIGIGAQMIGLAAGALDRTMPYLHERQQFGSRVADFQGVQHQVAQLATELEAARLLVYNAARLKESGMPVVKEAAMAKLYSSQVAEDPETSPHTRIPPAASCDHNPIPTLSPKPFSYSKPPLFAGGGEGGVQVRRASRRRRLHQIVWCREALSRRQDWRYLRGHLQHSAEHHRQTDVRPLPLRKYMNMA